MTKECPARRGAKAGHLRTVRMVKSMVEIWVDVSDGLINRMFRIVAKAHELRKPRLDGGPRRGATHRGQGLPRILLTSAEPHHAANPLTAAYEFQLICRKICSVRAGIAVAPGDDAHRF